MSIILQSYQDAWHHKTRSFIAIISIAWGIYIVLMLSAFGKGIYQFQHDEILKMFRPIFHVWLTETSIPHKGLVPETPINIPTNYPNILKKIFPEIKSITMNLAGIEMLSNGVVVKPTYFFGTTPEYFKICGISLEPGGRHFSPIDIRDANRVLVISIFFQKLFFGKNSAIDKIIYIHDLPFQIVGVIKEAVIGQDHPIALIPITTAEKLWGKESTHNRIIAIALDEKVNANIFLNKLKNIISFNYHFSSEDHNTLYIDNPTIERGKILFLMLIIQTFLLTTTLLTLSVGAINLANIMYLIIQQRQQEIGLKISIGATPKDITVQFTLVAAIFIVIGGALSLSGAICSLKILHYFPIPYYLGQPKLSLCGIFITLILLGFTALFSGYLPARHASRLNPIAALNNYSSERKRITLTLIAIAWGTFATIVMLAVGHGTMISSLKTLDTLGSNVLSIQGGDISAYNRGPLAEPTISLLPYDYEKIIHTVPNIIRHTPDYIIPSAFENNGLVVNKKIEGVNDQFALIKKLSIQGRFIDILDLKSKKNVVVLGNNLSKILFHNRSPIASHIHINGDDFLVIGIVTSVSDTNNIINNLAYIPATTFQTLYSPLNIDEIVLQFKDPDSLLKARSLITSIIARHNQVSAADPSLIYLKDNLANVIKVQNFYKSLEFILGIIGFCTMCVASLGVISVIYLAIQNSISSIGIRLALGETLKSIAFYYLCSGLTIVAIGNIIGSFFASIAIYSINLLLANISIITINKIQLSLSWQLAISIFSLLLIIGLLSSTFSILQLRHINPIEALRHE